MGAIIGMALWALIPGFIAKKKGRNFWGYFFLSFLISPLITTIITLCISKKTDECRPERDTTPIQNKTIETENICFCRKCGEKLLDNSQFCRKCGTEVVNGATNE